MPRAVSSDTTDDETRLPPLPDGAGSLAAPRPQGHLLSHPLRRLAAVRRAVRGWGRSPCAPPRRTTDRTTAGDQIITRYAGRWGHRGHLPRPEEPHRRRRSLQKRTRAAVERTVPFTLITHSMVITSSHLAGHHPCIVRDRRGRAPWYTKPSPPTPT
jgi:hypothetical protein